MTAVIVGLVALSSVAVAQAEQPFKALSTVKAEVLSSKEMDSIKGKATPLQLLFLQTALQTNLGSGVILYGGNGATITASWNTGSSSGSAVVTIP